MDRYVRVQKQQSQDDAVSEDEIRIQSSGTMRNYISYATSLLTEEGSEKVALKALGHAISKAVTIAEILKRRVKDLHQLTEISSVRIVDTWEPIEEGLNTIETQRQVSMITITLSVKPLDSSAPGYQAPLPHSEVQPIEDKPDQGGNRGRGGRRGRGDRGRGRGRGDSGGQAAQTVVTGPDAVRGRGRGGRRGGESRGRGRGGGGRQPQ